MTTFPPLFIPSQRRAPPRPRAALSEKDRRRAIPRAPQYYLNPRKHNTRKITAFFLLPPRVKD